MWAVLDMVGQKKFVESLGDGLDSIITEGGSNMSSGQRQLLCMARALLRKAPIIIMDEATSSTDSATDAMIQEVVRSHFAHSTVLIIAHRLDTIIDCDRILVLDAGKVGEFDTPAALLSNENSHFRDMVAQTGAANADLL